MERCYSLELLTFIDGNILWSQCSGTTLGISFWKSHLIKTAGSWTSFALTHWIVDLFFGISLVSLPKASIVAWTINTEFLTPNWHLSSAETNLVVIQFFLPCFAFVDDIFWDWTGRPESQSWENHSYYSWWLIKTWKKCQWYSVYEYLRLQSCVLLVFLFH